MPLKSWAQLVADAGDTGKSFEPLPDGVYDFVIEKAEHRRSASEKDGYNITANVETGPYKKRVVFNTFWVSPDSPVALGIFLRQMAVLGLDSEFFSKEPSDDQIVAALAGKRFRGGVKTSEWQGKKRNEISTVEKPNPALTVSDGPGISAGPSISSGPSLGTSSIASAPSTPTVTAAVNTPSVPSTPVAPVVEAAPAPVADPAPAQDDTNPWANASVPEMPTGAPSRPF